MFETISKPRPRRPAAGIAVAIVAHAAVLALALSLRQKEPPRVEVFDIGRIRPPPKGAPGPSAPDSPTPRHRVKPKHKPSELLLQPVTPPPVLEEEPPPVVEESFDDESEASNEPGIGNVGVRGGDPNGVLNGSGDGGRGRNGAGPVRFEEGMTPPRMLFGPDPKYTPQALEREIEGTMLVRCIVTTEGVVQSCLVLRSLPFMDAAVIQALERRRYSPALLDGRPIDCEYIFRVQLKLP